ncbi:nucleoside-diphosphate-sugar pyrophosphorylase [Candidatus Termititenax persephonae]|uniref:Nucleoside-diphosphate-sugar pyrophosphorylase n=1 Tax=Candidatus Termititenax persephonae TaxID=2218525 RepID=A0A388TFQ3_9BACT|nr:nucleoside-diphosphate-sugar pyrophosphorylase [Candidatus Termititenax persephonae]
MHCLIIDVRAGRAELMPYRELPGQDILVYQISLLRRAGFKDITVLSDFIAEDFRQAGITYYACPRPPKYAFLKRVLNDQPFLLLNGPALTDYPLNKLAEAYQADKPDVLCLTGGGLLGETFYVEPTAGTSEIAAQIYIINPLLLTYYYHEYFETGLFLTEMLKHRRIIKCCSHKGWSECVNNYPAYLRAAHYLLGCGAVPGSPINNLYYGKKCEVDFTADLGGRLFFGDNCQVGAQSRLQDSLLLGQNTLGGGVRLTNCLLQKYVTIGNNCVLENCLIGERSVIGDNVRLTDFVLAPRSVIKSGSGGGHGH